MTVMEFRLLLAKAVSGNKEALADIIEMYMPLINRYSYVGGKLDEDLRQHILIHILKNISHFSI